PKKDGAPSEMDEGSPKKDDPSPQMDERFPKKDEAPVQRDEGFPQRAGRCFRAAGGFPLFARRFRRAAIAFGSPSMPSNQHLSRSFDSAERLRLRPLRRSDLDDYAALYADPEVLRYLGC